MPLKEQEKEHPGDLLLKCRCHPQKKKEAINLNYQDRNQAGRGISNPSKYIKKYLLKCFLITVKVQDEG